MGTLAPLEGAVHWGIMLLLSITGHHLGGGGICVLQVGRINELQAFSISTFSVHWVILLVKRGTVGSVVGGHDRCLVAHEHWICVMLDGGLALGFMGMSIFHISHTVKFYVGFIFWVLWLDVGIVVLLIFVTFCCVSGNGGHFLAIFTSCHCFSYFKASFGIVMVGFHSGVITVGIKRGQFSVWCGGLKFCIGFGTTSMYRQIPRQNLAI